MSILINHSPIKSFKFSGGEWQVRLPEPKIGKFTAVKAMLKNSDDILKLILSIDAIRRQAPTTQIELILPYVPYARQDRVCETGEALSIVAMANIINLLKCEKVIIYDPHSDVTPALIHNSIIKCIEDFIIGSKLETFIHEKNLCLVAPDAGAEKKVRKLAKSLNKNNHAVNMIAATKIRDTLTGNILQTKIAEDSTPGSYLVVDDICDGGQTIIELAKALKKKGAKELYLYITHGIFAKGIEPLLEYYQKIYCVNTWLDVQNNDRVIVLEDKSS